MRIGNRKFSVLFVMMLLGLANIGFFPIGTYATGQEVYVVAADSNGRSNYILSYGDGTFSGQEYMGQIPQPYYTYGCGIGDFDNDGDFDYVIGTGYSTSYQHHIYLYEKLDSGNDFASPVSVDTWTEGYYPMDFAVADYNNDGNMDFVLTHYGSSNSELYLGNGDFAFTRSVLSGTAPYYSIGADSADFNNDGNLDFVAAQYGSPAIEDLPYNGTNPYYIYVNLGNGDGTFATTSFEAASSAWGVTAADFDNDGNADIISGGMYTYGWNLYKGNGDGTFQSGVAIDGVTSNYSPIDNYDFDSDGFQDIIMGYQYSARYYSGNGDGTFTYVTEIGGGSGGYRYAISTPPPPPPIPGAPHAIASPEHQVLPLEGGTANFDGSASYDEDGWIVSYFWEFGDGYTATGAVVSHVYSAVLEKTIYRVRLTVTDNEGKKGYDSVIVKIAPPEPTLILNLDITPSIARVVDYDNGIHVVGTDAGELYVINEVGEYTVTELGAGCINDARIEHPFIAVAAGNTVMELSLPAEALPPEELWRTTSSEWRTVVSVDLSENGEHVTYLSQRWPSYVQSGEVGVLSGADGSLISRCYTSGYVICNYWLDATGDMEYIAVTHPTYPPYYRVGVGLYRFAGSALTLQWWTFLVAEYDVTEVRISENKDYVAAATSSGIYMKLLRLSDGVVLWSYDTPGKEQFACDGDDNLNYVIGGTQAWTPPYSWFILRNLGTSYEVVAEGEMVGAVNDLDSTPDASYFAFGSDVGEFVLLRRTGDATVETVFTENVGMPIDAIEVGSNSLLVGGDCFINLYVIGPPLAPAVPFIWPVPAVGKGNLNKDNDYARFNPPWKPNHYHTGIDIWATTPGTAVVAAGDGVVVEIVRAETNHTHGMENVVVIEHTIPLGHVSGKTKVYTLYAHMISIRDGLKVGDNVIADYEIGKIYGTVYRASPYERGTVSRTHLHFEVKDEPTLGRSWTIIGPAWEKEGWAHLYLHNPRSYPSGSTVKYWGYTPYHPDNYGYHDPILFLHQVSNISPVTVRVNTDRLNVRHGPDTSYLVQTTMSRGQEFVAFRISRGTAVNPAWYQVRRPDGGLLGNTHDGWVSAAFVIVLKSSADLIVTDPDGLRITKEIGEVQGMYYMEYDINGDGELDDIVAMPERKIGDYIITVIPVADAAPTDTYTLEAQAEDATVVLAENVPISDIPLEPYVLSSTALDIPPATLLAIGEPKFVVNDITYSTSATPVTLIAEDNPGGSGVASTAYRIYNATYDSGWIMYTQPFYLTGLTDGTFSIDYNSTDNAGNVELTNAATVIIDNTGPSVTILNPPIGWALQDGVTFIASAIDFGSGVFSLNFSIREANGGEGTPVGFEELPATYNATTGKWTLFFDTLQLPDGYYVVLVKAKDNLGNMDSVMVPYSIRNWAVIELLPASETNKAGRTMPVKFTLRVAASVDPNQPFVYNEDLVIKIYATDNPDEILQESTFGDTARDYRIDDLNELYITNFKTLKTPTTYVVQIYRKEMLIDSFDFSTVK